MLTEVTADKTKRTKNMQPRYALLYRLSHNSPVFKYVRCNTIKPALMELTELELDQIKNDDFSSLKDLGIPKILEPMLAGIAYGASLTEAPDEDSLNLISDDVMVLEFQSGSTTPCGIKTLDKY